MEQQSPASTAPGFDLERSPRYRLAVLARLWINDSEKFYDSRFGVSLSEWRILAIVGAEQPINAAAIADRGLLEKPHISRLVARLIGRGLLHSQPDADDARRAWLYLTEAGTALFGEMSEISLERDALFVAPLNARERASLCRLLDKLIDNAPRQIGAPSG
jgi:DNA-binding MarR family transcriptional regulator